MILIIRNSESFEIIDNLNGSRIGDEFKFLIHMIQCVYKTASLGIYYELLIQE